MDLEEQYDKIYRYCYFKLHHQQMAEDITQETFLRFWESNDYCERGQKLQYLYKILYPISDYPHEHYTFKHFEV